MRYGNDWEVADPKRLRDDCAALGIVGEPSITVALRTACKELTPACGCMREDLAAERLCKGKRLYEFIWDSASRGVKMYFKFSLFDGRLVVVTFHKAKYENIRPRKKLTL